MYLEYWDVPWILECTLNTLGCTLNIGMYLEYLEIYLGNYLEY